MKAKGRGGGGENAEMGTHLKNARGRIMARRKWERVTSENEKEIMIEMKTEICHAFRRVAQREGWTDQNLAQFLQVSRGRIGWVTKYQVEKLTFNQLFKYLVRLSPRARILVST